MRKEQECENTAAGEIRKERGEKGLGIGEQSLENDVSVRSTVLPVSRRSPGSSGAL